MNAAAGENLERKRKSLHHDSPPPPQGRTDFFAICHGTNLLSIVAASSPFSAESRWRISIPLPPLFLAAARHSALLSYFPVCLVWTKWRRRHLLRLMNSLEIFLPSSLRGNDPSSLLLRRSTERQLAAVRQWEKNERRSSTLPSSSLSPLNTGMDFANFRPLSCPSNFMKRRKRHGDTGGVVHPIQRWVNLSAFFLKKVMQLKGGNDKEWPDKEGRKELDVVGLAHGRPVQVAATGGGAICACTEAKSEGG